MPQTVGLAQPNERAVVAEVHERRGKRYDDDGKTKEDRKRERWERREERAMERAEKKEERERRRFEKLQNKESTTTIEELHTGKLIFLFLLYLVFGYLLFFI